MLDACVVYVPYLYALDGRVATCFKQSQKNIDLTLRLCILCFGYKYTSDVLKFLGLAHNTRKVVQCVVV